MTNDDIGYHWRDSIKFQQVQSFEFHRSNNLKDQLSYIQSRSHTLPN